jgi:hypothetical protein
VRAFAERIGLYRVAAFLIACALAIEIVRVQVRAGSSTAQVACTLGEVLFLALAATVFVAARRRHSRNP